MDIDSLLETFGKAAALGSRWPTTECDCSDCFDVNETRAKVLSHVAAIEKERDDANKIAAAAKAQNERLVSRDVALCDLVMKIKPHVAEEKFNGIVLDQLVSQIVPAEYRTHHQQLESDLAAARTEVDLQTRRANAANMNLKAMIKENNGLLESGRSLARLRELARAVVENRPHENYDALQVITAVYAEALEALKAGLEGQ